MMPDKSVITGPVLFLALTVPVGYGIVLRKKGKLPEVRMRLLFSMDQRDYADCTHSFRRDSARAIIRRDGKVAMIHSLKYDYYKFPGGGIEAGESPVEAMIRETREEAGLIVLPGSVREYGCVRRAQRSDRDRTECFLQDNFYYLCEVEAAVVCQQLDGYEAKERYTLEFVDPQTAIEKNRSVALSPHRPPMLEREARVLELLCREGYLWSAETDKEPTEIH